MKRKIISIDENLCNGCGLCVSACHEGAIQMVDGKAKLVSDSYCDGLGDCLPACPTDAIQMIEREAADYDEAAVQARMAEPQAPAPSAAPKPPMPCGCPGEMAKTIERKSAPEATSSASASAPVSELTTWPVQIKLVNPSAPYLKDAALLVAADCTAFAYADIHNKFMRNKVTLIGCPKLDEGDYADKLTAILQANDIKSLTVLRMEVPCCGGIADAAKRALQASGKMIPWQIVTVATDGSLLEE
jgi:Pyruvate/2-oxoacid:ferredoxin oxidoreductase delta subunit